MTLTTDIALFLILFGVALVLFITEWFSADVTALGMLVALILFGLLDADAAFANFGSNIVIMILGLLILTEALTHTGLVDVIGHWALHFIGESGVRLKSITLIAPSIMSAFVSNTASTAFFLPIILGLSRRTHLSTSKLLMPLAFASILAGSVTLIGSSTNLIASGLMQQYGLEPLGFLELTPVGLPILIVGLIYMATIGQRLIPDHTKSQESGKTHGDLYFTEITITSRSTLVGKSIEESGLIHQSNLGLLSLQRQEDALKPLAETILDANDILLVEGKRESILSLSHFSGVEISGKIEQLEDYKSSRTIHTAEVIVLPGSRLIGRTIKGLGLRDRYQLQILAVNQAGEIRHSKIGRLKFNVGDVLLIKLPQENLRLLETDRVFRVLDIIDTQIIDRGKILLSSSIFIGVIALSISGLVSIAVAALTGAFLIFLTRCITPELAYRNIEWKTIILIASMLAFGQAMQETGTADFIADLIVHVPGIQTPMLLLSLFFLLAMILTQPMSNQAASAVLIPIAIQTAVVLNYNPRPLVIMITLGASASFITPLEPACVLIYSAGRYKFMDFIRVGGLLTILIYLIAIALVPMIWTF